MLRYVKRMFRKMVYELTPIYRLSEYGIIEKYENKEWKPHMETSNFFRGQMGKENYEIYIEGVRSELSGDKILVFERMRLWARTLKNSVFTFIGICITILGLAGLLPYPFGVIIGLTLSIISIMLNLEKEKKPLIPMRKKQLNN